MPIATDVEGAMQAALIADAGVTALVSADRIKVGFAGQSLATPYIIHFPVTGTPTHTLEAIMSLKEWEVYQLSVFGDTYASVKAVAKAIVAAVGRLTTSDGVQFMLNGEPRFMGVEPNLVSETSAEAQSTGSFHMMMEFKIFEGY
jgi:hypothetical protein